jgi:formylglycine-generating enzyme required for sulfatase activity
MNTFELKGKILNLISMIQDEAVLNEVYKALSNITAKGYEALPMLNDGLAIDYPLNLKDNNVELSHSQQKILSLVQNIISNQIPVSDLVRYVFAFEPEMVFVKGGTFKRYHNYELRNVTLSDFYIGRFPVTQIQWSTIMGTNPSFFLGDNNRPVERITQENVMQYCDKLSKITGKNYSLLTEAQWEFAARGGNMSKGYKYSGSNYLDEVAWYLKNSGHGQEEPPRYIKFEDRFKQYGSCTHPVGQKKGNELGIYDMCGNVFEICLDSGGTHFSELPVKDPVSLHINNNFSRKAKGGSFANVEDHCTIHHHFSATSEDTNPHIGFRVAISKY